MNIFKQTKAKKVLASVVGLTVGFTMTVGAAGAATVEELTVQIEQLMAEIAALKAATPAATTGACTPYTFATDLTLKSTGADVKALQQLLNSDDATQVAASGVGSKGMETDYFGNLTKAAVMKFQEKHGIAPVAGYVGPKTRAKLNTMCSSTGTGTGDTGGTTTTGPVTVSLAASSPMQGGLIAGQAGATLADFEFKGAGTVTSVTLKRFGFSDQNALSAVYLYDGTTRLTDGYTFNSNGDLVMNNLNIAVNGSKVITVKGDVPLFIAAAGDLLGYQSNIAVALSSYTSGGTATPVSVQGGYLTYVAGSLAGVTLTTNSVAGTPSVNAGTANYTVWGNTLSISTRAAALKGAVFKMIGSAPASSLSNIALIVDGSQVGNYATVDALGNITFDVSATPVTLATGAHTVEVRADIVGGSDRSFYVSLQKAGDIVLTDSVYGANTSISSATFIAANYNAATISIGQGTIALTKDTTFNTSNDLTSGAANTAIAKYKLQAYGEDVKVMQMIVAITDTPDTGLQNVSLFVNGAQVGSSQNLAAAASSLTFSLGSSLIVPAGTSVSLEVRADLLEADSDAYAGTLVTDITIPTSQAQGMSSYALTSAGSPGTTSMTVSTGTATLAKSSSLTNQSIAGNTSNVKIGSYVISAGATEGVRVTNLNVAFTGAAGTATTGAVEVTDIGNLTISLDGGLTKMAPVNPSLTSNNFSVDFTVAANQTKNVDVYADITAATDDETIQTTVLATARGASSNIAITTGTGFASAQTGQLMTVGSGSLSTLTVTANTDTAAQYIVGGTTARNIIRYNLTATGGALTVQKLVLDLGTTTEGAITRVTATGSQGGSCPASEPIGTTVTLTGCNIVVPKGFGGTDLIVKVDFGTVGDGGVNSNSDALVALDSVQYYNGVTATTYATTTVATSSTMKLVASLPTFTLTGSGSTLVDGQVKVGSIKVEASAGGNINLNALPITITMNAGGAGVDGASTTNAIVLKEGNTTITTTDNLSTDVTSVAGVVTFTNNEVISAGESKTYDIYVTFEDVTGGDDAVTLSLASAASLDWDDVMGGGTGLTGTLISAYPTNTVTLND